MCVEPRPFAVPTAAGRRSTCWSASSADRPLIRSSSARRRALWGMWRQREARVWARIRRRRYLAMGCCLPAAVLTSTAARPLSVAHPPHASTVETQSSRGASVRARRGVVMVRWGMGRYGMYKVCAATNDVAVREVPLQPDFSLNVADIKVSDGAWRPSRSESFSLPPSHDANCDSWSARQLRIQHVCCAGSVRWTRDDSRFSFVGLWCRELYRCVGPSARSAHRWRRRR